MMHRINKLTILAACVLALACTTEFNTTDTSTDTATDTSTDTSPPDAPDVPVDGTDVPTDTSVDVEPDIPLPTKAVECTVADELYVYLEAGSHFDWGCDASGDCADISLHMQYSQGRFLVITGTEMMYGTWDESFWGNAIDPVDMATFTPMRLDIFASDPWRPWIGHASLVQQNPEAEDAVLLFVTSHYDPTTMTEQQNIRVLRMWAGSDLMVESDAANLFDTTTTPDIAEVNMANPRGVRVGESYVLLFQLEYDGAIIPTHITRAGTLPVLEVHDNTTFFNANSDFMGVGDDATQTHFPLLPALLPGGIVAQPFIQLDFEITFGAYVAGMWTFQELPGPGGSPPLRTMFQSDLPYTSSPAVGGAGTQIAAVAFASENVLNMSASVDPPADVVRFQGPPDAFLTEGLFANSVVRENNVLLRNMEEYHPTSIRLLYDGVNDVYHYVHDAYTSDEAAQVAIYSFNGDGSPAMIDGIPFKYSTGGRNLPAYDVAMDPETGDVYIAHFNEPNMDGDPIDGYNFARISCTVVDI